MITIKQLEEAKKVIDFINDFLPEYEKVLNWEIEANFITLSCMYSDDFDDFEQSMKIPLHVLLNMTYEDSCKYSELQFRLDKINDALKVIDKEYMKETYAVAYKNKQDLLVEIDKYTKTKAMLKEAADKIDIAKKAMSRCGYVSDVKEM